MRVISNRSTGTLGQTLAKALAKARAKVTVLEGPVVSPLKEKGLTVKKFTFYDELALLLTDELKNGFDAVIHAAAVSDFRPKRTSTTKIPSGHKITLKLVPVPKLIDRIKWITPETFLVGFKLEPTASEKKFLQASEKLIEEAGCDLVVANSETGGYKAALINDRKKIVARARSRQDVSLKLIKILSEAL